MNDDEKRKLAKEFASKSTASFMDDCKEKLGDIDEVLLWLKEDVAPAYILLRVTEAKEKFDPSASAGTVLMDTLKKFQMVAGMLEALRGVMGMISETHIDHARQRAKDFGDGTEEP